MKTQYLLIAGLLLAGSMLSMQAQLIVHEPFSYAVSTTNPDPDGAGTINSGNGLPATNVGGNPAGTSVGFRGNYGTMHTVVNGLTYSNAGGVLQTSANALKRTDGSSYGTEAWIYRNMTTDPFADFRASWSGNWLGFRTGKSNELYFSVLVNVNAVNTATNNRLVMFIGFNGGANYATFIGQPNGSSNWVYADQAGISKILGPAEAGKTELIVGKLSYPNATSYSVSLWFNPTLGQELGTPTITQGYPFDGATWTNGADFRGITTRDGVNILTYDEFRMGLTAADVMPVDMSTAVNTPVGNQGTKLTRLSANSFLAEIQEPEKCVSVDVVTLSGMRVQSLNNIQATNTFTLQDKGMYLLVVTRPTSKDVVKIIN